ncbi:MAG TPA: hypothetical protein VJX71_17725 [Methylomirabilota bacterium]|nr:hypothetical protein [Methylomirabilota bacterium]
MSLIRMVLVGVVAAMLAGCGDKIVQLRYDTDPAIERVAGAQAVTVFRFTDARGDEGDRGDVRRVGGIYGGYGNRLSKVMAASPWPETLVQALTAGLTQRGIVTTAVADREYRPGATVTTPLILSGEIRNFSTEQRWSPQAHVGGIVRLYDQQGTLLVEKRVSVKTNLMAKDTTVAVNNVDPLEPLLNETLQKFVRAVVTDPDLSQRLVAGR